jgi:hypothetical protein
MELDLSRAISPIEIVSTFVSIITFLLFAILFFLALSDQRIVVSYDPDHLDRIVVSNAIINEVLRWLIGTALLIIWVSGLLSPPQPDNPGSAHTSLVALAIITMTPFMQVVLLGWGLKDLVLRRRILRADTGHEKKHVPISLPPDLPPGKE